MDFNGILLVDKPKGWTSFDVVAKVRGILRQAQKDSRSQSLDLGDLQSKIKDPRSKIKVGHTGTLDPSATGLLVLCIGKATKLVPSMIKHDKTYEVEMTLGATSTTGDQEGVITKILDLRPQSLEGNSLGSKIHDLSSEAIEHMLNSFIGEQMQTPPAYSAIKVDGKRAYELARAGKEVKLEPRKCNIYSLRLVSYKYPIVNFTTEVSSGTYIRSLVEDIGKKLGCGSYMSELRRTKVAEFRLENATRVEDINIVSISKNIFMPVIS